MRELSREEISVLPKAENRDTVIVVEDVAKIDTSAASSPNRNSFIAWLFIYA